MSEPLDLVAEILRQPRATDVAARWKEQYCFDIGWRDVAKESIYRRLRALPEDAPASAIDAVMGTNFWTRYRCAGCGTHTPQAIQIGEPPDYESDTVTFCPACAQKLMAILRAWLPTEQG